MTDAPFQLGDRVVDTDTPPADREETVVVELPERTAEECYIAALETTVAEANPDHPPDAQVVTVAFVDDLEAMASGWGMVPPEVLADELALIDDITLYTYPATRLTRAEDS